MNQELRFKKYLRQSKAYLHFKNGSYFQGYINRNQKDSKLEKGIWGEAAFTTAHTGYQETATDPSFLGQHIIFATAHVGTYEANHLVAQSAKIHGTSLMARHFSFNQFLEKMDVPLFSGLDTRELIRKIAQDGLDKTCVLTSSMDKPDFSKAALFCNELSRVSQKSLVTHIPGERPIVVINYGMKDAILKNLIELGHPLVSMPHHATSEEIIKLNPRMIFLSNGPGDPSTYTNEINVVAELLKTKIPLRAICLGHQLTALALEAKTYALAYGHRGINHPVINRESGKIEITSQNHGYAVDEKSLQNILKNNFLQKELAISHMSIFDGSIEGITALDHSLKTVQHHPEAHPGPVDAATFFVEIKNYLQKTPTPPINVNQLAPLPKLKERIKKPTPYKRILIVGSGPIKIGQASEFDYSGTQALKSLKEEGIEVVLLNSNPATIMTDPEMAYRTYLEPITKEVLKKIILKEKVDAVLSTMGGQTALNICVDLANDQFLEKHGVALLGANVETIKKTEDRKLFAEELDKLGYKTGKRFEAANAKETIALAKSHVGLPLIIRRDFALGGKGAALIHSFEEFEHLLATTDVTYPISMEKSLIGQKEIELEVMVDCEQNGVIICSIENVDPCGVHTGDSITVAPAQTISDRCYQQLRTMTLTIAKHMGVVAGGANVQFAINPLDENDITVIEMNPRVSRSSALASKATGYPIAKISALLSIGYTLKEIINDITKASPVAFEPSLDYVAVKIPLFPFGKFPSSSRILGPQMRSVGEVLALGGSFNEAFLKALRSLETGLEIPSLKQLKDTPYKLTKEYLKERLKNPQELSLLTCLEAIREGMSIQEIYSHSNITPWFIRQVSEIAGAEEELKEKSDLIRDPEHLLYLKSLGLSDKYLALLTHQTQEEVFDLRSRYKVFPVYKAVDTCSGEFKAQTPYYYSTFQEFNEAQRLNTKNRSMIILGSGPTRIGQGIEFDYSCVKACMTLKKKNIKSIMINSNPETVSTDYDSSDRLYLGPLYSEDLFDIFMHEQIEGVISVFSGQTGIGIREHIEGSFRDQYFKTNFLGPTLNALHLAEDREKFSKLIGETTLSKMRSRDIRNHKELMNALADLGFPVIIRPSFVIGGESMYIFRSMNDIEQLPPTLQEQLAQSSSRFLVEEYLEEAHEYDVDVVRDSNNNLVFTVCEHIEHAGVHSGDSGMCTPALALTHNLYNELKKVTGDLASRLEIVGPINFQFAIKNNKIYCIEANPRGSRTIPFLSKAYFLNMPELAVNAMLGESIQSFSRETSPIFCVKQSTFPFDRFLLDNIILGPKMRSTGETMGLDRNREFAMLKSYLGNYPDLNKKGILLFSLRENSKKILLPYLRGLIDAGYEFMATEGTAKFISKAGYACITIGKIGEKGLTLMEAIKEKNIRIVFNTPNEITFSKSDGELIRNTAISFAIPCFTRDENIKSVIECLLGTQNEELKPLALQEAKEMISGNF